MDWKEINAAIQEKLTAAGEGKEGDDRESAVSSELQKLDQAIRQPIYDAGFGASTKRNSQRIAELEREVETAKTAKEAAEARATEAEKAAPDLKAIREQHEAQIRDLKQTHDAEKARLDAERKADRINAFRTRLTAAAGSKLDPAYAELQILKMNGRIDVEDGLIKVKQPGKDLPYLADSPDSLIDTVVKELVDAAPADRRLSKGDKGGGASGEGRGSGSDVWEKARQRGKDIAAPTGGLSKESQERRLSSL